MNIEIAQCGYATAIRGSIEQQFVAAVDRSELRHQPFDHIYMEDVLDPASYAALARGDARPALLS